MLAPPNELDEPMGPAGPRVAALPAIEAVYREHYEFVWRLAGRFGVPAGAVDDAVQDVFVVLHRRREELDGRGTIRALLFGVIRRVARGYRDRARREVELVTDDRAATGGPDEELARRQAATVVREALAAMDEDKRMAFVLADLEGMAMPEVAQCLEINLNTAYSRVRLARQLLQRAIARHRARDERRLP